MRATPTSREREVIAVVGSGFSGTMVAVNLARLAERAPVHVVLFERGERFARGVAYGTECADHLLNVPAAMMSALPDDPGHFLTWLKARDPEAHAGTFAPRRLYGEYLESLLNQALDCRQATIELVRDEIVDIRTEQAGSEVTLIGRGGTRIRADRVVLALGNPSPHDVVECPPDFKRSRKYVGNSWDVDALNDLGTDDSIVMIGSGLSAVDLIVEAQARGLRGRLTVISRHGLLPLPHRPAGPASNFPPIDRSTTITARSMLKLLRELAAHCAEEGKDWRPAIDGIRPLIQDVWKSFCVEEKRRFVRHLSSFWDVHRHRIAPEVARTLDELRAVGRLTVIAGRIQSLSEGNGNVRVALRRRGESNLEQILCDRVINCTGPTRRIHAGRSPLVDALIVRNLCRTDPLGLGLEVGEDGALMGFGGESSESIYALGPILKGQLWETTAVRELRSQALDLARHLTRLANRSRRLPLTRVPKTLIHGKSVSFMQKPA